MYNQFYNQDYSYREQPFLFPGWDTFDQEERWEIARCLSEDGCMVDQNGYVYASPNFYTEGMRGDVWCRHRCNAKFGAAMLLCAKYAPGSLKIDCINAANEARKKCRNRCGRID